MDNHYRSVSSVLQEFKEKLGLLTTFKHQALWLFKYNNFLTLQDKKVKPLIINDQFWTKQNIQGYKKVLNPV